MRTQFIFQGANPTGDQALIDASSYDWVIIVATGLGAAEVLTINRIAGSAGAIPASINDAATVTTLTLTGSSGTPANRNQVKIDGGTQLTVTGTAAAVTINVIYGQNIGA